MNEATASRTSLVAAFVRRDWTTARSYRLPFAMEISGTALSLLLFYYLARLVDRADLAGVDGMERGYFAFVVVGMAVFQAVQSALVSFSAKLRTEQTTGTLEALLATPAPPSLLILASATYDLLRGLVASALMIALAAALGLRLSFEATAIAGTALALVSLVGLFAALGVAVAAFGIVFKQSQTLLGLVTSGIALLGGVWFPVELFPAWLEVLAQTLPFTWGIDVLRAALITGDVEGLRLAGLTAAAAVGLPVALWLFRAAVDHARRAGSLGQY